MKVVLLSLTLATLAWQTPVPPVDRVLPNDNRIAAGVLANGVLTLHLEARLGRWFPDGHDRSEPRDADVRRGRPPAPKPRTADPRHLRHHDPRVGSRTRSPIRRSWCTGS